MPHLLTFLVPRSLALMRRRHRFGAPISVSLLRKRTRVLLPQGFALLAKSDNSLVGPTPDVVQFPPHPRHKGGKAKQAFNPAPHHNTKGWGLLSIPEDVNEKRAT
ncbi:uncharacterized protein LOC144004204 isoform X1 [Festucalex cinctus]